MSEDHPPKIGYIGQDPETYRLLRQDARFEMAFAARIAWLEHPFAGWADRLLARVYRARVRGAFPRRWRELFACSYRHSAPASVRMAGGTSGWCRIPFVPPCR